MTITNWTQLFALNQISKDRAGYEVNNSFIFGFANSLKLSLFAYGVFVIPINPTSFNTFINIILTTSSKS